MEESALADATYVLSVPKSIAQIQTAGRGSVRRKRRRGKTQNSITLSWLPVTSVSPSGLKSSDKTRSLDDRLAHRPPVSTPTVGPTAFPPDANNRPSGLNETE